MPAYRHPPVLSATLMPAKPKASRLQPVAEDSALEVFEATEFRAAPRLSRRQKK